MIPLFYLKKSFDPPFWSKKNTWSPPIFRSPPPGKKWHFPYMSGTNCLFKLGKLSLSNVFRIAWKKRSEIDDFFIVLHNNISFYSFRQDIIRSFSYNILIQVILLEKHFGIPRSLINIPTKKILLNFCVFSSLLLDSLGMLICLFVTLFIVKKCMIRFSFVFLSNRGLLDSTLVEYVCMYLK